jgi:peptide/nickel transport system ATP-binding protein
MPSDGESAGQPSADSPTAAPAAQPAGISPLLFVEHLSAGFAAGGRVLPAIEDVSLAIAAGETLGLVGESGSGKSVTALSIVRLLQPPGKITAGRVRFQGTDLLQLPEPEMRQLRGAGIGFIFQEPMSALTPVMTVGDHVAEALVVHGRAGWAEARRRAVSLLDAVRIPDAPRRARDYPHQLSGGMRQRVMMAVALACDPPLVIADEPTTSLDVSLQAEMLDLLMELRASRRLALLLITHDLGVVARTVDRVAVMYAGRIVEQAPVSALFASPRHPYTRGLLASIPGPGAGTRLHAIEGAAPGLGDLPPGCAFEPRCGARLPVCRTSAPATVSVSAGHAVACWLYPAPDAPGAAEPAAPDAPRTRRPDVPGARGAPDEPGHAAR